MKPATGDVCETGRKGICAAGVIKCVDGNIECNPVAAPASEICGDGLDNDCDGETDNGCSKDGGATGKDAGNGTGADAATTAGGGPGCSCGLSGQGAGGWDSAVPGLALLIMLAATRRTRG